MRLKKFFSYRYEPTPESELARKKLIEAIQNVGLIYIILGGAIFLLIKLIPRLIRWIF